MFFNQKQFQKQLQQSLSKSSMYTVYSGKHLCWRLVLKKLQASSPATVFTRDSNTGAFL